MHENALKEKDKEIERLSGIIDTLITGSKKSISMGGGTAGYITATRGAF